MEAELIKAIESNNLEKVKELLAAGANPNAKKGKKTVYQIVSHRSDLIKCELIEAGAEDPAILHSLVWVILNTGRVSTVKYLIEPGADVNVDTYSGTPLQVAAGKGYLEIVELLIEAGADSMLVIVYLILY